MAKNIIFCADGTWNTADETSNGIPDPTNVYKLSQAAVTSDRQDVQYDDGVGADGTPIQRLLGGAIGDGLFAKIKQGYDGIARSYDDGDSIFLFGFSRGAYTARSLAGMIAICGLPAQGRYSSACTDDAFAAYRSSNRGPLLDALRNTYGNRDVNIAMVGVWDTVGALGIPGGLFESFDADIYGFLNTNLHPNIQSAYHALAIDERRALFPPTLWDADVQPNQEVKQVWFAGVHSDVGGGYPETQLSDVTLGWMMKMAAARGVLFSADAMTRMQFNPSDFIAPAHESWSFEWGLPTRRTIPVRADMRMASCVFDRWNKLPDYRPPNAANILTAPGLLLETETIE